MTFFGGYDLYIIAIISPLEPERAAEARKAVVASLLKTHFSTLVLVCEKSTEHNLDSDQTWRPCPGNGCQRVLLLRQMQLRRAESGLGQLTGKRANKIPHFEIHDLQNIFYFTVGKFIWHVSLIFS